MRSVIVMSGVLAASVVASYAAPREFALDRGGVAAGEIWRLWTGHLVHWSFAHFMWDGLTFAVLAWLLAQLAPRCVIWLLILGSPLVAVAVLVLEPGLQLYAGLSGLDVALWVALCGTIVRRSQDPLTRCAAWLALLGGIGKVTAELANGQAMLVGNGVTLAPSAHLSGAFVGLAVVVGSAAVGKRESVKRQVLF